MIDHMRRYLRDTSGIAAVEFALIAPVLFLILAGVIDYGAYLRERMMLEELSRNAAQYIAQGGDPADVMDNVVTPSNIQIKAAAAGRQINYSAQETTECANGVLISSAPSVQCPTGDYKRHFWEATVTTVYQPLFPWPGVSQTALSLTGFTRLRTQ